MTLTATIANMNRAVGLAVKGAPKTTPKVRTVGPGIQAAAVGAPKALFGATAVPKKKAVAAAPLNPYDAFNVADPYDPTQIHNLATTGYNTDVTQAQTLSQMGGPTAAQIDAQSANRAAQQTALGSSLAAALNGIQQAYVTSGNAGATSLAGADAATAAGGARSQSIAGAPPASTAPTDAGVSAVLAGQTAGTGNLYGGLEASALSSGDQAAKAAYATGETLKQTQADDQATRLAALLANVQSESARESSMTDANTKVDDANKGTALSIWNSMETRRLTAQAEGDKKGEAAAALDEKKYEATLGAKTKAAIASDTNASRESVAAGNNAATVQAAKIGAAAKVTSTKLTTAQKAAALAAGGTKPLTPSQKLSLVKQVQKTLGTVGGVKKPAGQVTTGYTVTLTPDTSVDPTNTKGTTVPVSAAVGANLAAGGVFPGYPNQKIAGIAPKTKAGSATTTDMPSTWTKWKRALGSVQATTGMTRTQATQWMAQIGYPAPKS